MSGALQKNRGIIATRTPNRTKKPASKSHKFEFDAPQFEDFCHPRYFEQRKLLEEIVLPPEQRSEWSIKELPAEDLSEATSEGEWFQRPHLEHEPTSPFSPVGALITPESNTPRSTPRSMLRNSGGSPLSARRHFQSPNTPVRGLGLRSRPQRILPGHSGGSSYGSPPMASPLFTSPITMEYSQIESLVKSPTTRWQVTMADPRSSSSIERSVIIPVSDTSLPTVAGWSSIPETPPILASAVFDPDIAALGKRSLPKDSPMVKKEQPMPLIKRIGLASRALRVPAEIEAEVEESNSAPMSVPVPVPVPAPIPVIKRLRVDAKFCPAPLVFKSKNGSKDTSPIKAAPLSKKEKPVKLYDLKKLLAEHNQKLRPQMNITRRR
jgi:hypothetical protein